MNNYNTTNDRVPYITYHEYSETVVMLLSSYTYTAKLIIHYELWQYSFLPPTIYQTCETV